MMYIFMMLMCKVYFLLRFIFLKVMVLLVLVKNYENNDFFLNKLIRPNVSRGAKRQLVK